MPLIYRITADMFDFSDIATHMVNPVNLVSVPGAGLALEFRRRCPDYVESYREACRTQELRIGTLQLYENTGHNWDIINFPTKRHYREHSSPEDIKRGLEALRDMLEKPRFKYSVVGMPMLGCGLGAQDYEVVLPLMQNYLDGLDATVILSMSPERTEMRPRYLSIAGNHTYGHAEKEAEHILWTIDKCMEFWAKDLSSYAGILMSYKDALLIPVTNHLKASLGLTPLVIHPDQTRHGGRAYIQTGLVLCEIAEDIILFKPKGQDFRVLNRLQQWLIDNEQYRYEDGQEPKRVAIVGDKTIQDEVPNVIF